MILEVENGCFGYPKQKEILKNINLHLEKGHILSVLGPNGIGKTTLLKCMIGLLPWTSGRSLLNGTDLREMKSKDIWNTISYIPQAHSFSFSYTGLEMVMLGRSSHLGLFEQPGAREIEMAEAMMEKVGITRLAGKDCNRMSGGELQMVLIARALINEPELIILDDFLLHTITDEREIKILFELLEKRNEQRKSTIVCSQRDPDNWKAMILNDLHWMRRTWKRDDSGSGRLQQADRPEIRKPDDGQNYTDCQYFQHACCCA